MNKKKIIIGVFVFCACLTYLAFNSHLILGLFNGSEVDLSSVSEPLKMKRFKSKNMTLINFGRSLPRQFESRFESQNKTNESTDDYQSCAVAMCGLSQSVFSYEELEEIKRNRDTSVMSKYENLIEENLNTNVDLLKEKINFKTKIKDRLKKNINAKESLIEVNDAVKKIIYGIEYIGYLYEFFETYPSTIKEKGWLYSDSKKYWNSLEDEQINLTINKMSLNSKDRLWFKEMLKAGFLLDLKISIFAIEDLELDTILRILYPKDNLNLALKKQIKEIVEFTQFFSKAIGMDTSFSGILFPSVNQINMDPNINLDTSDLTIEIKNYYYISQFFNKKYERILSRNFDWNAYVKKVLNLNPEIAEWSKNNNLLTKMKAKIKNECLNSLTIALDQSNSALKNKKFNQYLQDLILAIKDNVKLLSKEDQNFLDTKLRNLNIIISKDLSYLNKTIESTLRNYNNSASSYADFIKNNQNGALQLLLINSDFEDAPDLVGLSLKEKTDLQIESLRESLYDDISGVCRMYMEPTLSDRMLGAHGQGKLSWSSVRFPKFGVGIAAHEIGHYVSTQLKTLGDEKNGDNYLGLKEVLPLWEARSCINSWAPANFSEVFDQMIALAEPYPEEKARNAEGAFTEENWADYFSAKIIGSMRSKYPWIGNFACQLLNKNKNGNYITKLDHNDQDTHSSGFKRALLVQKVMGLEMPRSCQKIIKDQNLFECLQ
jgi:hypothetical protein